MSRWGPFSWPSLGAVLRRPLIVQPLLILGVLLQTAAWIAAAAVLCAVRIAMVLAGLSAFIGGIVLCLVGQGYVGAPLGVIGLVASRLAA